MPETSSLGVMLQVDAEHAILAETALRHLMPGAEEGLEEFAACFERLTVVWGKVCDYDTHNIRFAEWAKRTGIDPAEALRLFSRAGLVGKGVADDSVGQAHGDLHESLAAVARSYLTVRLKRDFLFGLTDLLRLRLTAAVSYFRVQTETAALIKLMAKTPTLAREWFSVLTDQEGEAFYKA